MLKVLCYEKCSTCRKALKWLDENHIAYELRPIIDNNPSFDELNTWYKSGNLPLKRFWNTSGLLYKENHLKEKIPFMSEEEQLQMLSTDGKLVKRPFLIGDDFILTGFKEEEWASHLL